MEWVEGEEKREKERETIRQRERERGSGRVLDNSFPTMQCQIHYL